jgi:hypothetical protein
MNSCAAGLADPDEYEGLSDSGLLSLLLVC